MKERIVSAIIMLIIFVPILIIGSYPFYIFMLILSLMATYELLKLKPKLPNLIKIITYLFVGYLVLYNYLNTNYLINFDFRILFSMFLVYLTSLVVINDQEKYNYKDAFSLIGITLFLGISFNNFIYIRNTSLYLMIYLFLITIITDSFALFVGKKFGKRKVAPKISPNKTIEGCIGGSLFGCVFASLFYILVINNTNILLTIVITLFLTIIGQFGDLVKSSIKRHEKIKDFSNLIPGHGGILDRLDSIIFVIMTYILISNLI